MRLSLRLALAALLAGLAGCDKAPGVQACPARYQHLPQHADYLVLTTPAYNVPTTCKTLGDTMPEPLGCYSFNYHIAVVPTCNTDPVICKALLEHENCHDKGWPADHPP